MVAWMNGRSNLVPFVGMMMAILTQSGSMVVIKVAISDGINKYVMVVYSMTLSSIMLLPLAFLLHRSERPPLTFSVLCSFFLLALMGSSAQIMSYVGIELSSPTLASAILNLIPAFTFLLALIFRMEIIHWRHSSSQAKVIGTIVSITGAFVVILYKGPPIFKMHSTDSYNILQFSPQLNWILGGLFCAGDSFLSSMWYIYQVSVTKKYPAVTVIVFFQIFFTTILSGVFALIAVRDPSAWQLKLDKGLIAILYQELRLLTGSTSPFYLPEVLRLLLFAWVKHDKAIAATVIRYILTTWCVQRAGPLFCAMFKPVAIIFTVFMGSIFLGDDFHLGSLIGAVIIVVGFYAVLWGKASEEEKVERGIELESSCHDVPLLQNKT